MRALLALIVIALVAVGAYGFKNGWFTANTDKIQADVDKATKVVKEKYAQAKDAAAKKLAEAKKSLGQLQGAAAEKAAAAYKAMEDKYKQFTAAHENLKDDAPEAEVKKLADLQQQTESLSKEFEDLLKLPPAPANDPPKVEPKGAPKGDAPAPMKN